MDLNFREKTGLLLQADQMHVIGLLTSCPIEAATRFINKTK
jgi:hypothetical protein